MSFIVHYPGAACTDCGEEIKVGEEAAYVGDGDIDHVLCPTVRVPTKAQPVCTGCRMELPVSGVCGECT